MVKDSKPALSMSPKNMFTRPTNTRPLPLLLIVLIFVTACRHRPVNPRPDAALKPSYNLLVLLLPGGGEDQCACPPGYLGGPAELSPDLDRIAKEGILFHADAHQKIWPDDLKAWGYHTCFAGYGTHGLDRTSFDYGIGEPSDPDGLPRPDPAGLGGQGVHIPVRRSGMTAPIPDPMTRPYLVALGGLLADFALNQARQDRPWALCVSLDPAHKIPWTPDTHALYLARKAQVPEEEQSRAARLAGANQVASAILTQLTWLQLDQQTLTVLISPPTKADPGRVPIVLHAPGHLESFASGLALHEEKLPTLIEQLLRSTEQAR